MHIGVPAATSVFDCAINDDAIQLNSIPLKEAGIYQNTYYYGNKGNDRWLTINDGVNVKFPLKGLSFDASQMEDIVNTNAFGTNPDKVIFKIGGKKRHVNYANHYEWHVIAYGQMNNGTLLNTSNTYMATSKTTLRAASIYDKADPYPPH